ncbi:hypothetical protein [Bradyrhizobium sp. 87]|uniref:hypothetical protein n=1 Tax=Bradyrhizobium sp. 87 TaxID=2782682 RepID=UPI001FFBED75|nr:hypothetical protein [Bradyrhizobium sp. 87]MCK1427437.1 hypothetical protein [Bradyrhizobium sp. 87]
MTEQLHTLTATIDQIVRDSFLAQPLLSIVALIITAFLLVLEYYLVTTDKPGRVDKHFLVENENWLKEMRSRHLGSTFKPSSKEGVV